MTGRPTRPSLPATALAEQVPEDRVMDPGIRPLWAGMPAVTGPVHAVRCAPGDNLMMHAAVYRAAPGSVIVVDAGGSAGPDEGRCEDEAHDCERHDRTGNGPMESTTRRPPTRRRWTTTSSALATCARTASRLIPASAPSASSRLGTSAARLAWRVPQPPS